MKTPVVYVAGPFRAENAWEVEQNIRRAEEVALRLWQLGCAAICPHANSRYFSGAAPDEVWLAGDLAILERCDAIILVPGWEKSSGTVAEHRHARYLGIPAFETWAEIKDWLPWWRARRQGDEVKPPAGVY